MTKFQLLVIVILLGSCIGKNKSDAQKVAVTPVTVNSDLVDADTVPIKVTQSKIDWVATEMRGTIKRIGTIQFQSGYFLLSNEGLAGGKFTVDMETINITDLPAHETIARENLINHLRSDDFFNVATFPTASFEITRVDKMGSDSLNVTGNLVMRDIKKSIRFSAYAGRDMFKTRFTFDRTQWSIAYEGSWADKTLIDKDIELDIEITTEK